MHGRAPGKRGRGRPRVTWIQYITDYSGLSAIEEVTASQDKTDWKKELIILFDSAPKVLVDFGLEDTIQEPQTLTVLFDMALCIIDEHSAGLLCIFSVKNKRQ